MSVIQFRYFKGDMTKEPLKTIIDTWYKLRAERDEKLTAIFNTIPFYESWLGDETSIFGIVCSYDNRKTGDVVVKTSGKVVITAGNVEVTAPCKIVGDVNLQGNLTASGTISGGSVKQGSIELSSHKHNEQGDGKPTSSAITG